MLFVCLHLCRFNELLILIRQLQHQVTILNENNLHLLSGIPLSITVIVVGKKISDPNSNSG